MSTNLESSHSQATFPINKYIQVELLASMLQVQANDKMTLVINVLLNVSGFKCARSDLLLQVTVVNDTKNKKKGI